MDGVIVVDKPPGWTSHDVVNRVRRIAKTKRVGHLGTLDPMATGVLPLVIGRATRLAQFFQRSDKVYECTVQFGYATDSYDADGSRVSEPVTVTLDRDELDAAMRRFHGRISQVPPKISAKKIGGTPAYKLARRNIDVEMKPVEVEIFSIEILRVEGPEADLRIHCSAGTYVRSIAHDLGTVFGCGAFLNQLRRTASGGFDIEMANTLERLAEMAAEDALAQALIRAAELIPEFPAEMVDTSTASFIRQGRDFRVSQFVMRGPARYVKAVTQEGDLVAIGEAKLPNVYHPILVL